MKKQITFITEQKQAFLHLLKWLLLILPVSLLTGSLVALFLWSLDLSTQFRQRHEYLLWLLPVAGIVIHAMYRLWGRESEKGNNLVIEEIHQPAAGIPPVMAPLVMLSTVITHLFGGSAGREGTAVQVGGSVAAWAGRYLRLSPAELRILLMTGVAAGFGAVFGTPIAGAIFALEVLAIGRIRYEALLPCLAAAIAADIITRCWGIHHTTYTIRYHEFPAVPGKWFPFNMLLLLEAGLAGILFGWTSRMFVAVSHAIKKQAGLRIKTIWLIPVAGGILIIAMTWLAGTTDYLGLGVHSDHKGGASITAAFGDGHIDPWCWLWKILFTAITLGTGFKGGEVTPLFFIGATLGHSLAFYMGLPADLFAGLGFIAVFAGAANTPLACTLMGAELFGSEHLLYYAVACFLAYYCSGHSGIYSAQRVEIAKHSGFTVVPDRPSDDGA